MTDQKDSEKAISSIRQVLNEVRVKNAQQTSFELFIIYSAVWISALFVLALMLTLVLTEEWIGWQKVLFMGTLISAIGVIHGLRIHSKWRDDQIVAAKVEEALPSYRTDIRATLELTEKEEASAFSGALRVALAERISEKLQKETQLEAVVPQRDLKKPHSVLSGAIFFSIVLFIGSARFQDGATRLFFAPETAFAANIEVEDRILVSAVNLVLDFPSYTALPDRTIHFSTGDLIALEGTRILFSTETLVPVTSLRLVSEDSEIAMEIDETNGRSFSGEWIVLDSSEYNFQATLPDGSELRDAITRHVRVLPDQTPSVELFEPASNLEVRPTEVLTFRFIAGDDFGLSDVSLVWYFAAQAEDLHRLPLFAEGVGRTVQDSAPFDLAPLALQPGDEVIAFIEATDAFPNGPNIGRSRAISLSVASPDDLNDAILAAKQQLFEHLLVLLGGQLTTSLQDRLAITDLDEPTIEFTPHQDTSENLSNMLISAIEAHEDWPETLEQFAALLALMERDELTVIQDFERLQAAYNSLYVLERDLHFQQERHSRAATNGSLRQQYFDPIATLRGSFVARTEQTILLLEDLIAEQQADSMARTLEQISNVRERLRELLEQYRDTNDPELLENIMREISRLEARLQELIARLQEQSANLPYEHLNMEALEASEAMQNMGDMVSSLDQIRNMLAAGDIDGALAALDQLDLSVDSMMNEFGAEMRSGGSDGISEFDQQMAELMDQVNDLEMAELNVEEATNELIQEMRQQREEEIQDTVSQTLENLQQQLQVVQQNYALLEQDNLPQRRRASFDELEEGLERLSNMLSQGDVSVAEEQATNLISRFGDISIDLRTDEALFRQNHEARNEATQGRRFSNSAQDTMLEMQRTLRELMNFAQPQIGPGQRAQLDELGDQQAQVQQQLGELQNTISEFAQRFPTGEGLDEPLNEIGQHMEGAQNALRGGRPQPALQGEQSALQGLRTMRQNLQQRTQQQRMRERMQRGPTSQEEVEIPNGQQDRVRFRQEVIDAMREDHLESYDEEIRAYYESLVE